MSISAKKLFLLDGFGATISALLLGIILVKYIDMIGMPRQTLFFLALFPTIFAVYDFACCFAVKQRYALFLRLLAVANLIYCVISAAVIFQHFGKLTPVGLAYFMLEILLILILASAEVKLANKVSSEIND